MPREDIQLIKPKHSRRYRERCYRVSELEKTFGLGPMETFQDIHYDRNEGVVVVKTLLGLEEEKGDS